MTAKKVWRRWRGARLCPRHRLLDMTMMAKIEVPNPLLGGDRDGAPHGRGWRGGEDSGSTILWAEEAGKEVTVRQRGELH
jgi:hypothetical protein